jgi:membrane associated rhomboid family serine protease
MDNKLTWSLIILNVVVFEIVFSMPEAMLKSAFELFQFMPGKPLEIWRWLTSLFMHAGASHLFLNMLALYFFGSVLESQVERRHWIAIYFLSGLAGNIAYAFIGTAPAVGASGCIFGIMGAATFIKPKEPIRAYLVPLPLGIVALVYTLSQIALVVSPSAGAGVAYQAHIGGLIAGSLMMFLIKPKESFRGFLIMAVLLIILLIVLPLIGFIISIGQMIIGVIDFLAGIVLYGIAKYLISWIW